MIDVSCKIINAQTKIFNHQLKKILSLLILSNISIIVKQKLTSKRLFIDNFILQKVVGSQGSMICLSNWHMNNVYRMRKEVHEKEVNEKEVQNVSATSLK